MSPDAATLHCPNCGAIAEPDAGRCPYCQARLAVISCPACFERMFDGATFCPHCGARSARREAATVGGRCPGCGADLQRLTLGDTTLLECAACDGVWMDADEFERMCADRQMQTAVLHRFGPRGTAPARPVRYRHCVRCRKMMNRVNFGRMSGTVVDVCRGHGTFMDTGELHRIVEFIRGGGLDRARELQIEELKEQEQRLLEAERRAAHDAPAASALHQSGTWDRTSLRDLLEAIRRNS
jgi:Zn-finger nucleic acid-binding protein